MDARKKKALKVKKAATTWAQYSKVSSIPLVNVGQKKKPSGDGNCPSKKPSDPVDRQDQVEMVQKML